MTSSVGIVDYGVGNLFSIQQACQHVGLDSRLVTRPEELAGVQAVILPGVGAFAPAMERLRAMGMVETIRDWVDNDKILLGICLGFQLFMTESHENGHHEGLGLIDGSVRSFRDLYPSRTVRVPNIGWRPISCSTETIPALTKCPLLRTVNTQKEYYFVHSYYADVNDESCAQCWSTFEDSQFCCAVAKDNILGVQFHPERSARQGLGVFAGLKKMIDPTTQNISMNERNSTS